MFKKVDPPYPGGGQQLQRNFKLILRDLVKKMFTQVEIITGGGLRHFWTQNLRM